MRSIAVILAGLVVSGCFPPDLGDGKVACGANNACPPDYFCHAIDQKCWKAPDGTTGDMASTSTDMAMVPDTCQAVGMRVCPDIGHSAICPAINASPMLDRTCPPGSMCSGGHCQPPPGGTTCRRAADCVASEVCTPFVVGTAVTFTCAMPMPGATGGAGATCAGPGIDTTCKSGYCARVSAKDVCDSPCNNAADCGGAGCGTATLVVEGVAASNAKSCSN